MKRTVNYYSDPVHDDFAINRIESKKLSDNYSYYYKNKLAVAYEKSLYFLLVPLIDLVDKIVFGAYVHNKKVLRKVKGGYFIYGNHTNGFLDAISPSHLCYPKKVHIIVNPDAVSIKGLAHFVKLMGAVPTPSSVPQMKQFLSCIDHHIKDNRVIMVYPEAHIWPYYTDIRPFLSTGFHYPVELNTPIFTSTVIYKKRWYAKRPRVSIYLDGPFYPDQSLSKPEAIQKLRDEAYSAMKKRVDSFPKYNYVEYVKVDDESKKNNKE